MHAAAANGDIATVEALLARAADAHVKDRIGYAPLHWAALNGRTATVELLLVRSWAVQGTTVGSSNINRVDSLGWFGNTALHLAACEGHASTVEVLLAHSADVHIKDHVRAPPHRLFLQIF